MPEGGVTTAFRIFVPESTAPFPPVPAVIMMVTAPV